MVPMVYLSAQASSGVQMQLTPQDGDLVVTYETSAAPCYTVRQHPGDPQFSVAQREEAIRLACGFARQHGLDVWYVEHGVEQLLASFRPTPDA